MKKQLMKNVYLLCGFLHIFRRKVHICGTHEKKYLFNKYNLIIFLFVNLDADYS